MGVLTQTTRQQVRDLLTHLSVFGTRAGRDLLLRDWPPGLADQVVRSEATAVDLDQILYTADGWWPPAEPVADYPLRLSLQVALEQADGSQIASALQALVDQLPATLDASARPRCPYPGMIPSSRKTLASFMAGKPRSRRCCGGCG